MFDWSELTLFIYIIARISGFLLFNPMFNRKNFPAIFRAGFILVLSVFTMSITKQRVGIPVGSLDLIIRISVELMLGYLLGLIVHLFFYIPQLAGQIIDTQMGMTMNQIYDAGAAANLSVTAVCLNILMTLVFFSANGHHTMIRIFVTSGDLIPFGGVKLNSTQIASALMHLFAECTVLAVKLSLPILAAELLGQLGMGILMKVIPQINVFSINIELKMIIGMVLLLLLITPFTEVFLEIEVQMLNQMSQILKLVGS